MYESLLTGSVNWDIPWEKLADKRIVVAGATGLLGAALMELLLYLDREKSLGLQLTAVARDRDKLERKYGHEKGRVRLIPQDVTLPLKTEDPADYIVQAAGNSHPVAFSSYPIDTVMVNVLGSRTLLDLAAANPGSRFLLYSSGEIYGQMTTGRKIREEEAGYLNCNTLRAGYPEGKRAAESLCQAYRHEKGAQALIMRVCRTYGLGMDPEGSMAITQFVRAAAKGDPIVLKSSGSQKYSFAHALDVAAGALFILTKGQDGEAYNVAGDTKDLTLRQVAELAGQIGCVPVTAGIPQKSEKDGYSKAEYAVLDTAKLESLGWKSLLDIERGMRETIAAYRE